MVILFAALVGVGLALVAWSLQPLLTRLDPVEARIDFYGVRGTSGEGSSPALPGFRERVLQPQLSRLLRAVETVTPAEYQARLEQSLDAAGHPFGLSPSDFIFLRLALAFAGFALGLVAGGLLQSLPVQVLLAAGLALGLWFTGGQILDRAVRARRLEMKRALPNAIDFLLVAVDAGLGFDAALTRVVDRFHNALTDGLAQALGEVQLGRSRAEALDAFGRRCGVEEVHAFIQAMLSSEKMGVPISRALRVQAEDVRWRQRESARELGSKATIKMLIPMVLFIFPTIWLILLGPALFQIFSTGL